MMVVSALRSIVFTIVFYVGCLVTVPGALLAGLVSRRGLYLGAKLWAGWFMLCSRYICGVRLQVEGVIPPGPHLFAIKHESAYETFLTLWLFDRPAVVMKAELRAIPVWGAASARHGSIFVDREGSATMLRAMMKAARAAVDDGRPVIIFPEGTRVAVGATPPLASGFAGLYKILKLPVVPVAIDSGSAWPKAFIKRPGVVRFRLGAPIPPGLPRPEVEAQVHGAINALQSPMRH
ncbi:MAG: 1-acyl-sn-glycerol-3-phosphate acyltransferase [Sandarakinorhabdus sp.]|nr:1-acyl-sn-glycerol-3-phosphate acyltransferase [Sandarakinorhabdus sp.]